MMVPLVPVTARLSVAVMVCTVPAVLLTVKATAACPLPSVSEVGVANEPPAPVLLHPTVLPDVGTELSFASASCAVTTTNDPADTVVGVTGEIIRYFVAVPGTTLNVELVPAV